MPRLGSHSLAWPLSCLLLAWQASASAQTGIATQVVPRPHQTIHVVTTQEMAVAVSESPDSFGEPRIASRSVVGFTQVNGALDAEGRMESRLIVERVEVDETINGTRSAPVPSEDAAGKSLTIAFRAGRLVDVRLPRELQRLSGILGQAVAGAYGALNFLPERSMDVGETTTLPATIPLRLPGSDSRSSHQIRAVVTLRAVERAGTERIARLDVRTESAAETAHLTVSGSGTISVNLDRGFVSDSATEWILTGPYVDTKGAAGKTPTHIRVSAKVTMTARQ